MGFLRLVMRLSLKSLSYEMSVLIVNRSLRINSAPDNPCELEDIAGALVEDFLHVIYRCLTSSLLTLCRSA